MRRAPLLRRIHAGLHSDERGFTMVEAMVAGLILAVGAFAVAQSLQFGLKSTGMARQRAAAETFANQQMEQARTLNYSHVILFDDPNPAVTGDLPTHSTDPSNPDFWVANGPPLSYDPDGSGPLGSETVISANTSPALIHHEDAKVNGNTSFTIDRYVTWVDSPADGLGASDLNSNPTVDNGAGDGNGHDLKRVTIVVTWANAFGTAISQLRISSLFSIGNIPYHGTTPFGAGHANSPPSVHCPLESSSGRDASFTAQATDSDGTVEQIDWDFGDGTTVQNGGVNQNHTYQHTGTYTTTNTVWDDVGATASNQSLNCTIQISNSGSSGTDLIPPTGTITIAAGATYTNTLQVVLTLSASDTGGSGLSQMQFSNDGVTFGAAITFNTTTLYTLPPGDGTKYVYAKFIDGAGNVSAASFDTITLDTTPPGSPTVVRASRTKITGNKVDITVTWSAPSPSPSDLSGYRVWRQISGGYTQVGSDLPKTTLSNVETNLDKAGSYTYCVTAFDLAGNESAKACIPAPV